MASSTTFQEQQQQQEESLSTMHIEHNKSSSSSSSSDEEESPFVIDQRVLCRDENNDKHFYESVIRKVKYLPLGNKWSFYIHYNGWNARWDRWVSSGGIIPDTPENRKAHLKTKESSTATTTTTTIRTTPSKKRKSTDSTNSRKRKSTDSNQSKQQQQQQQPQQQNALYYQEYCELPFTLQTIMVDEFQHISKKGFVGNGRFYDDCASPRPARSVHVLPATVTVKQVLQHYQKKRGGSNEIKTKQVQKFCQGLALLFDGALPVCLLFPEERPQYESMLQQQIFQNKPPSEIYGCEFLLRLVVRLPTLLQAEPKSEMDVMGPLLADLIVLLQKNRQSCFKSTFREPNYNELFEWERQLRDKDRAAADPKSPMVEK